MSYSTFYTMHIQTELLQNDKMAKQSNSSNIFSTLTNETCVYNVVIMINGVEMCTCSEMSMMVGGTSAPLEWGSSLTSALRSEWAMLTALGSFLATGGWRQNKTYTSVKHQTLMGDSTSL